MPERRGAKNKGQKKRRGTVIHRVIHLDEKGRIRRVEDGHGKVIKGKKEKKKIKGRPVISIGVRTVDGEPDERCIYSASGKCYC